MDTIRLIDSARQYAVSIRGEALCKNEDAVLELLDFCEAEASKIGETLGGVPAEDVETFRYYVVREYLRIYADQIREADEIAIAS